MKNSGAYSGAVKIRDTNPDSSKTRQRHKIYFRHGLRTTILSGLLLCSGAALAQDDSDDRIDKLERRLEQALSLIGILQGEVTDLRADRSAPSSSAAVSGAADSIAGIAASVQEVDERLTDIEDVVVDIEDRVGSRAVVNAFDAESLDIGGFLLSTLTHVNGEDGTATSFNRLVFELLVKAKLSREFSVFVAQAFTREASPTFIDAQMRRLPNFKLGTGAPTPIAWGNYRYSDAFNIRLGKWVTPHGIINVEHFPAILLDTEQPQFLRPFGGQTIFPNFQTGVNVHGKLFAGFGGKGVFKYDAYVSNFAGNQQEFNIGGRAGYQFGDTGLTIGTNVARGRRMDFVKSSYTLYGADVLFDKGPILWKTEIYHTNENLGRDRFAFYTQPAWRIDPQWTAFYRFDLLDDGSLAGDRTEHVIGLAFNPLPNIRIRSTATFRHFDAGLNGFAAANAQLYQLSTTLSF